MAQDRHMLSLGLEEWQTLLAAWGEPKFRAAQIFQWLHRDLAADVSQMSNLPKALRSRLEAEFGSPSLVCVEERVSQRGDTRKYLLQCADGEQIESVWMRQAYGVSVCISTQAGCRMGCGFCASTRGGLRRNLQAGEMLAQVYALSRLGGERISHVVIMGIGEPLDNYAEVLDFIRMLSSEKGLHISQRNITLSTCGLEPQIRELAKEDLAITLALSLHAAREDVRRQLMPIAARYDLESLAKAMEAYFAATGRRTTLEYALIAGVNDGDKDIEALAALARRLHSHVNLIPVNPIPAQEGRPAYAPPPKERINAWKTALEKKKIHVTIRKGMGMDIEGACGQLRGGRQA